uniref:Uncharacterized protein n=2 Tax=Brassica oleracea TaxID=3712 RepID=A0A0D3BBQ6_BRAOL|nr:unnamed protein product [Brassica oleracea]
MAASLPIPLPSLLSPVCPFCFSVLGKMLQLRLRELMEYSRFLPVQYFRSRCFPHSLTPVVGPLSRPLSPHATQASLPTDSSGHR